MKYLTILLLLTGCTVTPYWEHTGLNIKPTIIILNTIEDVELACRSLKVDACTDRFKNKCIIYIAEKDKDSCIMKHELLHCAGWTHLKGAHEPGCYTN